MSAQCVSLEHDTYSSGEKKEKNPQCLWLCNKSYAPGACTSVDAIRLLFDSYSKRNVVSQTEIK